MKVALIVAGCFRAYDQGVHQHLIEQFVDRYDCDLFAHTWNYRDIDRNYLVGEMIPWRLDDFKFQFGFTDVMIELWEHFHRRFIEEAAVVDYTRWNENGGSYDPQANGLYSTQVIARMLAMTYSRWRAGELMRVHALRNNIRYDQVIVTRFDQTLVLRDTLDQWPTDKITVDAVDQEFHDVGQQAIADDRFAIGPMDLMIEYLGLYPRVDWMRPRYDALGGFITGPGAVHQYLEYTKLPYRKVPVGEGVSPICLTYENGCEVRCDLNRPGAAIKTTGPLIYYR